MKKIGAVIVIICVILASLLLPAFIIELVVDDGDVGISPVKYEFPFKLVYEIDGETVVVEDTYICKYKGTR
ncbi:MAG: hypothetical protein IJ333_08740 [Clostridia bacterium]|nr:hypothetical protein [Clostridia bacterium]